MAHIKLQCGNLETLRTVDPRLMSYNVEMTEITGGTFWKAYTPEQISGLEQFPPITAIEMGGLMQRYDPIDTTNPRLIKLAKALGPVWVRISGTWATKTWYDFEDTGVIPEGYQSRLTRKQWENAVKFVDTIGAKLLISLANCEGLHHADEPWNPSQAKLIFELSKELGHPIDAVEFTNEPNIMETSGFPKGYKAEYFRRDQEICHKWVRENYPETLIVGPCATDIHAARSGPAGSRMHEGKEAIHPASAMFCCSTDELMCDAVEKLDTFSYHFYNGVSERLDSFVPGGHWSPEDAASESYLAMVNHATRIYSALRDKYAPGTQMWITEAGDASGGGDTWASTYLDVLRTLNEAGVFATLTDGVIFHNTLASSDYGWLKHGTFDPRPNYFAVLLWNTLMGTTVYDSGIPVQEGAHVYVHSYKEDPAKKCYLIINNSETDATTIEIPKDGTIYVLNGKDANKRATVMTLNGRDLVLGENWELPDLSGASVAAGKHQLDPMTCTFLVL